MSSDYFDGVSDFRRLAREIGQEIAASRPPNVLAHNGRAFWKLTDAGSGALAWLAFTRPDARSALARRTVWTLIPDLQVFIANWFVSVDHELTEQSQWMHTNIDVDEARELALLVPQPTAGDMKRITRPEAILTLEDIDRHTVSTVLGKGTAQAMMTRPNKQEFWEWAYDDLLTNTTRGVLAEYIVAKALGIRDTKRVEWDQYDLEIDGVGVEVKSAAYVQTWEQARISEITFGIRPAKGWAARTNTSASSAKRSAAVYVFCLLKGEDREEIEPLDVAQWTFYVLATSELDRHVPTQKTIRLGPLKVLRPRQCKYDELKAAIHEAAAVNAAAAAAVEIGAVWAYIASNTSALGGAPAFDPGGSDWLQFRLLERFRAAIGGVVPNILEHSLPLPLPVFGQSVRDIIRTCNEAYAPIAGRVATAAAAGDDVHQVLAAAVAEAEPVLREAISLATERAVRQG